MRKAIVYRCAILLAGFVLFFCAPGYAEGNKDNFGQGVSQPAAVGQREDVYDSSQYDLKKQCVAATVNAINMEIDRYSKWIELRKTQGKTKELAALYGRLAQLKADHEKYSVMDAGDYMLPENVTSVAWVEGQAVGGAILYIDNMSKSGPWYHLAGIAGGDYAALQPKTKLDLTFYPVYGREYGGMYSAYVYVADGFADNNKEMTVKQAKRFTGKVFAMTYAMPIAEKVECESYQMYLLKDNLPGAESKLVFTGKTSEFDFTLPGEMLAHYSYLEILAANGSKVMKLSEIKEGPLEIFLQPQVILKKPAIYLYPTEKTQIVVTHNFKGQILNTYPAYVGNWTVMAEPNGNLLNVRDNRSYKYLFWDGAYTFSKEHYKFSDGFYVKSQDYVVFLQSKLAAIGLNETEINDFIVYWLPAMNNYKNCFIHFLINDNIGGSSVLMTKPVADTTIRVFMEFSGAKEFSSATRLPEQKLPSFVRKGFTLIEWGGAEIGSGNIE